MGKLSPGEGKKGVPGHAERARLCPGLLLSCPLHLCPPLLLQASPGPLVMGWGAGLSWDFMPTRGTSRVVVSWSCPSGACPAGHLAWATQREKVLRLAPGHGGVGRASQERGPGPGWWQWGHRVYGWTPETPGPGPHRDFLCPETPSLFTTPLLDWPWPFPPKLWPDCWDQDGSGEARRRYNP